MLTGTFNLYGVKDGENANYMQLTCSLPVVSMDENNVQADAAVFRLVEVNGSTQTVIPTWFRVKVMAGDTVLETIDQTVVKDELSYMLPTDRYGNADKLTVEAYGDDPETEDENNYEKKLAEITVPISRRNPIPFPRSEEWSAELTFHNGEYLMVGNIVYMWRNPVPGNSELPPQQDIEQNPQTTSWVAYQNWPLLATQIFLAQWAKLGSFIFNGDIQMSQQGTVSGQESFEYKNPNFQPNYKVNAKTGKVEAKDMNITGGTIGDFKIIEGSIGDKSGDVNGASMTTSGFKYTYFVTEPSPSGGETVIKRKTIFIGGMLPTFTGPFNTPCYIDMMLLPTENHDGSDPETKSLADSGIRIGITGGKARPSIYPSGRDYIRQCGIRIKTDNGSDDYALDITGRVRAGGQKGFSGGIGVEHVWDPNQGRFRLGDLIFQDGICVGYSCHD